MVVNVCVFGAVALGPVVGGIQASAHAWRPLFWIIAAIALAALVLSVLTFQDAPPVDPRRKWDPLALGLAASGCAAAFFGASELLAHRFLDAITFVPLVGGLALIVILLVAEYRGRCALLNVRPLVSTLPATGILAAICAAAASVSAIALSGVWLAHRYPPLHAGLLYLPEFFGAALSAIAFGFAFRTRWLHYQVLAGMIFLSAGVVVIGRVLPPTNALALIGSGLIGLGVGSSVVPALFIAGFSLPNSNLQRVFAIIELLRAVAAFMIAPILLHFAFTIGQSVSSGTTSALWICFGISAGGALVGVCLYTLGGVRPLAPSLERWFGGQEPGWYSPPLLARIRRRTTSVPQAAFAAAASADDGGGDDPAVADRMGSCFRADRSARAMAMK
jgi:hypothetical protein